MVRRPPRHARGGPPGTPAPAGSRAVALEVLAAVRERDAFANLLLPPAIERARLSVRDAALATELTYGTLRMQGTLDWVVSLYAQRSLAELDPPVLDALRLGTYQLLYTDVPDHAAVAETVSHVRPRSALGFVNAILRRIADGREQIPWPTPDGDLTSYLAITYAHPPWLVRLLVDDLGAEAAEPLLRANNEPPPITVRVNGAQTTATALKGRFTEAGLDVQPGRWSPDVVRVRSGGKPGSWPGFDDGAFAVQDEASALAARAVDVRAGEVAVDLCAGPGGKTAALAEGGGLVVALEPHQGRAGLVLRTLERLGLAGGVVVVRADGRRPPVVSADAVLVDAPCSGLGVLRRRPEARWRVTPEHVGSAAELQMDLLEAGFSLLRPGGRLVYAVCTVTRAETTRVLERFCSRHPEAKHIEVLPQIPRPASSPWVQLLPSIHETDGMFVAGVERAS